MNPDDGHDAKTRTFVAVEQPDRPRPTPTLAPFSEGNLNDIKCQIALALTLIDDLTNGFAGSRTNIPRAQAIEELVRLGGHILQAAASLAEHEVADRMRESRVNGSRKASPSAADEATHGRR
jgi:hypothetical protein